MIRIGAKGLAKFMTASAAGQRKVLRDYKYPDEEGTAQAAYYREARDLIAEYHRAGHQRQWLEERAQIIANTASALGGRVGTRLRHNARALTEYGGHFGASRMDVLPKRKLLLAVGDVLVSVVPDLHVKESERERFMKLEFSAKKPSEPLIKIMSQLMFEAAVQAEVPVRPSDVLFVDVPRGLRHKGARMGSRVRTEIEAACANIAAVWPSI